VLIGLAGEPKHVRRPRQDKGAARAKLIHKPEFDVPAFALDLTAQAVPAQGPDRIADQSVRGFHGRFALCEGTSPADFALTGDACRFELLCRLDCDRGRHR